jgi:CubicO group peptidase (beta-lactamase class C family)
MKPSIRKNLGKRFGQSISFIGIIFIIAILIANNNPLLSVGVTTTSFSNIFNQNPISYTTNDIPTPSELNDFLDFMLPFQNATYGLAGVTFSFIQNNELVLTRGFGYSNLSTRELVDPDESIFRVGSISKTFTAIAALQLVEDGILDLDTDINDYLTTFQIPKTFRNPITLRHLLTHTAGFEESSFISIYNSTEYLPTLEEVCRTGIPDRFSPPGIIPSYSNYGYTLIGYLIELLIGVDFNTYIETEIFQPLGMNHSTFDEPVPVELEDNMSASYYSIYENETDPYFLSISPAASCGSTALDISNLMIALLDNGHFNGTQILQNETVQMMLDDQFIPHPNLQSIGFGLYEMDLNEIHVIGHGGDVPEFHSLMALFPEEDFGFFISYNSYWGVYAREHFLASFLESFFPFPGRQVDPIENYDRNLEFFEGRYVTTRRVYTEKVITLPWNDSTFIITPFDFLDLFSTGIEVHNGYLRIENLDLDFVQVEEDYFVEATGTYDFRIAFIRNKFDRVSHMYSNLFGSITALEKLHPIYDDTRIVYYITIPIGSLFLLATIWWIIEAIIRYRRTKTMENIQEIMPKLFPFGLVACATLIIGLTYRVSNQIILLKAHTIAGIKGLMTFPILVIIFLALMVLFSIFSWRGIGNKDKKPYWNALDRIFYTILTFLGITFIWVTNYWLLLGI